jgi:hypothetical protein
MVHDQVLSISNFRPSPYACSSSVGGGIGVGFPVGGEQVHTAYAADMTLTDVATGRLMWTSKITTPASHDMTEQVTQLVEVGVQSAQQAGFL